MTNQIWQPDLGNGRYRNPVLHADYSDPDVIRVGEDYYLTAKDCCCPMQVGHIDGDVTKTSYRKGMDFSMSLSAAF